MKSRILISAGGTGGHMFPANVLALKLLQNNFDVEVISDKRGSKYLTKTIRTKAVNLSALGNRVWWKLPIAIFQMLVLSMQTIWVLLAYKPNLIIGFGGYVTFPVLFFARLLKIPFFIHEQNSVMGRVNRKFAPTAQIVMTSFPQTKYATGKIICTGLPVREEIRAIRSQPYQAPVQAFNILVLGGSQGASIFSTVVPQAIQRLPSSLQKRIRIVQQCREEDVNEVRQVYQTIDVHHKLAPFIHKVAEEIAHSHLVITRSGASTLSEITTAGRPALYVPYPQAMDDHQTSNAQQVESIQGGWMVPQEAFTSECLSKFLTNLIDNSEVLVRSAVSAKSFGKNNALELIMRELRSLLS